MKRLRTARESDVGYQLGVFKERTEERLKQGAQTMAELREKVEELTPKPKPPWPLLSFGFVAVTALCGWVWQLARYPDRSEFESAKTEASQHLREIDSRLSSINLELERLRTQLAQKGRNAERR